MTASETTMTHPSHAHWGTLTAILDDLQSKVGQREINSIPDLLKALVSVQELPCITHQELSIAYRDHDQHHCRWVVHEGAVIVNDDNVGISPENSKIAEVLDARDRDYPIFSGSGECDRHDFHGYQNVLIAPMQLDDQRRIGVVVLLHKTRANAYNREIGRVLDVLGDRLALLIHVIQQRARKAEVVTLKRALGQAIPNITRECEVLERVLGQIREWYPNATLHILMKNPLDTQHYYLVNDGDTITQGFRSGHALEPTKLLEVVGGKENFAQMTAPERGYLGGFIHLPSGSWLGATLYHPEGFVLGHIVLNNTKVKYAYGGDDVELLNDIADIAGTFIASVRNTKKEKLIASFRDIHNRKALYTAVQHYLKESYGIDSLLIYRIKTATQDWDVAFQSGIFTEPDPTFRNAVITTARRFRETPKAEERKQQSTEFPVGSGNKYLVVPMRAQDEAGYYRVTGCFVMPAQDQGVVATRIIDEISDALGDRLQQL